MNKEKKNTVSTKEQHPSLQSFCNDLVNALEFAKRKNVSSSTVYKALERGTISSDDVFTICGKQYWQWSKYKNLTFRHTKI
jgi:predicted transcriptional regulator